MLFSNAHRCLLGVIVAAVAASTAFGLTALGPSDILKAEFRRPFKLVGDGAVQIDPVWKLGERLFFDTELSRSGKISCASCHQAAFSWSDSNPTAIGDNGEHLPFKAPTLLNVASLDRMGWTGRFADTSSVALFAMSSPATMNMPLDELVSRLRRKPSYVDEFEKAFVHDGLSSKNVGTALTRYVNSITSAASPFDKWLEGDRTAIDASARRGVAIFVGKGRCNQCHTGWTFTDGSFHDIGTAKTDPGRGKFFPASVKLQHAFKTPGLRGVAERAPYMHDGSLTTLNDVINFYDRGGIERPSRAEAIAPLHLTRQDKEDLKAFLKTLSSGTEFVARQ